MIIGTAGHIDHGKTTLVRALTGVETDRLKEEKARGISIELGYAYVPLPNGDVMGIIDVPGHERFVHTMAAGAVGIDHALLVVAADDGVMPQTLEHLEILQLLGVKKGTVALTMRLPDLRQATEHHFCAYTQLHCALSGVCARRFAALRTLSPRFVVLQPPREHTSAHACGENANQTHSYLHQDTPSVLKMQDAGAKFRLGTRLRRFARL